MFSLKPQTVEGMQTSSILQGIARKDTTAVKDCLDAYGDLVWALSRKFTRSREEAETATEDIFTDIWRYCERPGTTGSREIDVIVMIAVRRLLAGLRPTRQDHMIRTDMSN